MSDGWEFILLGVIGVCCIVYLAAYEWFLWRDTHRWVRHLHHAPVYGRADTHRLHGTHVRPNVRRVR